MLSEKEYIGFCVKLSETPSYPCRVWRAWPYSLFFSGFIISHLHVLMVWLLRSIWFHHNLVYLFVFCFLKIGRWWLLGNCGDKSRQRWGLSSCRWFKRSITRYNSANLLKYLTKLRTIIFWLNHLQFFAFWFQRSKTMRLPCYWSWTFLPRTSYASYLAIPANTSRFLLMLIISFCMTCCTHSDTFCDF